MDLGDRVLMKRNSGPPTRQSLGRTAAGTLLVGPPPSSVPTCRFYGKEQGERKKWLIIWNKTTETSYDENAGSFKAQEEAMSRK